MNLGDGLMFELENGKPRLVLAHSGEAKASGKTGFCLVPQKNRPLRTTATSKQGPKEEERWQRDGKHRNAGGVNHHEQGSRKTKAKSRTDHCSGVRAQSESNTKSDVVQKPVQDSLVCLTQEQLQLILNSIKASGQDVPGNSQAQIQNGAAMKEEETETVTRATGKDQPINSQAKGNEEKTLSDSTPAGLFSTFGECDQKRDTLKAKKAQWKRELDEQLALKMQQKGSTEVLAHRDHRRGTHAAPRSTDKLSGVQEDRIKPVNTEIANNQPPAPRTHSNPKTLHSAIRSAFVLGEATPLEEAFIEEKKEQQRRWLQELDQQREETERRRKLEKQHQRQAEDCERWAMHFDSFQRHIPAPLDMGSSLSHHRAPSQALSTASDAMSTYGGDSMGRATVDTTQGFQPRTNYLRTMTALLDPAQIEEREVRRKKRLEHQRAIEAQVEEQRRQKERDEAIQQAIEQEEERRIARERERLHQEYLRETQLQRQKAELQSRKTEELHLTVQRASEEAQKDKRQERIKNLVKKGHDVSNLLRPEGTSQVLTDRGSESLATLETRTEAPRITRQDIAVQTEINPSSPPHKTHGGIQAAVKDKAPPNMKRSRREGRPAEKESGKENVRMAVEGADLYEAHARTDRTHVQLQKPEWNIQKPRKVFVPASERYPAALQRHRQESRMRRQMELMNLMERNTLPRTPPQPATPRSRTVSRVQRHSNSAHRKDEDSPRVQSANHNIVCSRVPSPPVPAVLHRLQCLAPSCPEERSETCGRPPSSDYIPNVCTDEVYHLDPHAPISRPTTRHGPQKTCADFSSRQHTPVVLRDPLLHPDLLKSTERQQAILKGLSDLRQSLLQKQRELDTSLSSLLQGQSRTPSPAF